MQCDIEAYLGIGSFFVTANTNAVHAKRDLLLFRLEAEDFLS